MERQGFLKYFLIGIIFYIIYSFIIEGIFDEDLFDFPVAILSIYLLIAIFTFPVLMRGEHRTKNSNILSCVVTYVVGPFLIFKSLKQNSDNE